MILKARYCRNNIFIYMAAAVLLFSCNLSPEISPDNGKKNTPGLSISQKNIVLSRSVRQPFSEVHKEDLFRLTITGKAIVSGEVSFEIINSNGRILYAETFPAQYLLGYADDAEDKPQQKESSIRKRVAEFFNSGNFTRPAIRTGEPFDADYSDKNTWENIKSNRSAIGFYYLLGEENGRRIAYCKKLKQVLVFFSCC
jgi:hypothetical protein